MVFKALRAREQDLIDAASVLHGLASELERAGVERELEALQRELPDEPSADRWSRILHFAAS